MNEKIPHFAKIPVFFSYSHRDEKYKNKLETHLAILKRKNLIESWNDRKIAAGENWKEEIDLNLLNAKIVLLLVSSDFLASDYCYDTETIYALEQHEKGRCTVVPIILKPCLWIKSDFSHLQALPKDGKPITSWSNKEAAWLNVAEGISVIVEKINHHLYLELKESLKDMDPNIEYASHPISNLLHKWENPQPIIWKHPEIKAIIENNHLDIADNLLKALLQFLLTFKYLYFTATRIKKWGSQQHSDFNVIANYDIQAIEKYLEKLYSLRILDVKKNKKDEKLFRIDIGS